MIVPFPPGGGNDLVARHVVKSSMEMFGQPTVVDNRSGAGGSIGTQAASRATPDGYTLLMASSDTNSIYTHLYQNPQYNGIDFPGIAPFAKIDMVLVTRPGLGVNNLEELAALARTKQLTYSSWGIGSMSNLGMLAFMRELGVPEFLHVPYQGAAPAVMAALSGEVDLVMAVIPLAQAQPTLKPLGVLTGKRAKVYPDVPTMKEQGLNVELEVWIGLVAPPKTPDNIVHSLGASYYKAAQNPELVKALEDGGFTPFSLPTDEFQEYLVAHNEVWKKIVQDFNIRLD